MRMSGKRLFMCVAALVLIGAVQTANAVVIDFTGGTAYLVGGGSVVTNNTYTAATAWGATDYYEELGFTLDFIGEGGIVGDYYGGANDVIHGHWDTGTYGTMTEIRIFRQDGTTFDLNYFELTSNTDFGGGAASGNELTYVQGFDSGGTATGPAVLLPPDDWGWTGLNPQVFLGSDFDSIAYASFTVANAVDCFGMDMFYINEPAPPPNYIPEPGTVMLLGGSLLGLALRLRRRRRHA